MGCLPPTESLKELLSAVASPRPFIVLGAGTSVPLVPATAQIRDYVRRDFAATGSWPAEPRTGGTLFNRVFGNFVLRSFEDCLLLRNRGGLDLFVQKALTVPLSGPAPAQYRILRQASRGTTFFNYNLDSLASFYLGRQFSVHTPHGSLDREWTTSPYVMDYLNLSLDSSFPHLRPKVLPGPEPATITNSSSFMRARIPLAKASAVVMIGYSFALNPFGKLDDDESFEHFVDLQSRATCPILVLDYRPISLIDRLRDRLKSNRVRLVQLRWDLFSSALMPLLGTAASIGDLRSDSGIRAIRENYARLQ